jgi:hypothetical protein
MAFARIQGKINNDLCMFKVRRGKKNLKKASPLEYRKENI